jgi:hypothetical protein
MTRLPFSRQHWLDTGSLGRLLIQGGIEVVGEPIGMIATTDGPLF